MEDPYCQATLKAILQKVFFRGNKNICPYCLCLGEGGGSSAGLPVCWKSIFFWGETQQTIPN